MASQQPQYPHVLQTNPEALSPFLSNPNPTPSAPPEPSSSLYPTVDMADIVGDLFPDPDGDPKNPEHPVNLSPPVEETLLEIPGALLHLIDKHHSIELASGDLAILRVRQGDSIVAVLARVGAGDDAVQWPLTRDEAAVKLDDSHYFFSLHVPEGTADDGEDGSADLLNYGLTFASKGQESLLKELDGMLESCSGFSVQNVRGKEASTVLDGSVAMEITPAEIMEAGPKKEMMEERSEAYWTTLAPNVEDYSGCVAKAIAAGSGKLVKGILWCGDVTTDRIKWGNEFLKKRMENTERKEVSPETLRRIRRVKRVTKMSEKVATGILSGVVKVSGYFTSSVANSKVGKKFFGLLPGEIVLASLDGFGKICDAVEVAGKNVLSTSSVATTGLVSHRYGEQAAELTTESLDAAGHAIGTAWAVFKIRKALDPKSSIKPTYLAKSAVKAAAAELKPKRK
ncbi:protein EARLY-RESPONSIVE TO DEHYDRATION 7, chloroplastic [Elaeis guineensis]|uniref:Protein EARLY-RESPONSIVE TO DEHYDRATION 7, chloroplastic n=1 Tax=Elaeis guineensis var. tenera TaxID=51953 RepID=A0A6I9S8E2_ELAGV|nr:protein EARLY-RESPONSIVE TO DEHYDRATION 7, chloroplastic [Elaeis guineensis]